MWCIFAITGATLGANDAEAGEYRCVVNRKVDSERNYSDEQIRNSQFSVLIEEVQNGANLSRCSFSNEERKVTCDKYSVDHIVVDRTVKIKKYYIFKSQFDVQIYPDLAFVENNGRGGIAFGKCELTAP